MIATLICICLLASANAYHLTNGKVKGTTVDYPVRLTYIDRFNSWWPQSAILAGLGVPGYAAPNPYNYICLAFWTNAGPADAALVWSDIYTYLGAGFIAGANDTSSTQLELKKIFANAGVKLMVSVFGATENPTSEGLDPIVTARKIANFVTVNHLDGVDIDWEDSPAFQSGDGLGENWLIALTTELRKNLASEIIITHAPQGPYFTSAPVYAKGAYLTVHKAVGGIIDFYNVQFYNQGTSMYENANDLFNISGGWAPSTSVNEMIAAGVQAEKIVIGKPAGPGDANNGQMSASDLNAAIKANYPYNGWKTGIMYWQYSSDLNGAICSQAASFLMSLKDSPSAMRTN